MRIIPAIDLMNGKCVRLTQGKYNSQKVYRENPLDVALEFQDYGIQYLHLVDLEGAKANHIVNHKVLEQIALHTTLQIDFGGGIKSEEDLKIAFESGASQVTVGSLAATERATVEYWIAKYGADKIIIGADAKNEQVATHGWKENSGLNVLDLLKSYQEKGARYTICTDISKDGMLQGPSIELYKKIIQHTTLHLIASGGVSTLDDLKTLDSIGCEGAIIGKAIYEGTIALKELSDLC